MAGQPIAATSPAPTRDASGTTPPTASEREEVLRRFSAGVAHDFGNLLTVIRGFADFLAAQYRQPPDLLDSLSEIITAAARAGQMAEQLLAIGERQVFSPVCVDLNEALRGLGSTMKEGLGEAIALQTTLASEQLLAPVDQAGLKAMLAQLCALAKAVMPQGGTLTLMTDRVDADGVFQQAHPWASPVGYARLRVKDTAGPIDPAHLAHAFEPFYSQRVAKRGTALGAAVVRGWIRVHGGEAEADNDGQGTVISLYFPLASESATQNPQPAPPSSASTKSTSEVSRREVR